MPKRDYEKEYKDMYGYGTTSQVSAYQKANRKRKANRIKAREEFKKEGYSLKGKDIDHKDGNALNNKRSNLRVRSVHSNRADNKK